MNNITDDVKKYLGVAPYDKDSNIVRGDYYYYKQLCNMYGEAAVQNKIRELR